MLAARAVIIKIRFILPIKQPALYFHCRKSPTLNINKAFQLLIWLETNIQPTSTSTEHLVQHFFYQICSEYFCYPADREPEDRPGIIIRSRTFKQVFDSGNLLEAVAVQ